MLGERQYPAILAEKITGMLLEMDSRELLMTGEGATQVQDLLVNTAAFLAQRMQETSRHNACPSSQPPRLWSTAPRCTSRRTRR